MAVCEQINPRNLRNLWMQLLFPPEPTCRNRQSSMVFSSMALIYSTHHGSMCPKCRRPMTSCVCERDEAPRGDGVVRVGRETKGRKGAGVTIVTGLPLRAAELGELASRLKKKCATGGTARDGTIEIQGDHRDKVIAELVAAGYKVKRAGG